MLFSSEEKNNFKLFYQVISTLDLVIDKISANYLTEHGDYLQFKHFRFTYSEFTKILKYNFNYLESILSSEIDNYAEYIKDKINYRVDEYNHILNNILQEYSSSPHIFIVSVLTATVDFFNRIKFKNTPFEHVFVNQSIDTSFIENINILNGMKDNIKESDFKSIEDVSRFFNKYNEVDERLNNISNKYITLENDFKIRMDSFFASKGSEFDKNINNILLSFNKQLVEVQSPFENEIKTKISDLNSKYEESQSELITLLGNLKSYKNILSDKTQDEISKHYFLKAQSEKRMYWVTTITSILLILTSLSSVGWALYDYYHDYISITTCVGKTNVDVCLNNLKVLREASQSFGLTFFIMRFVFSLLLFLTVIYTSRIAIRAYNHWRHSENMHLKLVSLNPFIGNLDKDKRDEIHIGLVPDYFGKDAGVIEFQKDGFKDIPTNVANVAIKALEQAGGTFGGKSNTEKNDKKPDSGTE
ncbi:hypothetical protein OHW86_05665 [Acinetobacter baumannii]|nr:hypothetical protein [Acinetobacter baumannii]